MKIIGIIFSLILTDFYIFPFVPSLLPGINVKMILACISLPYIAFILAKDRKAAVNYDLVRILLFTLPITLFSWVSNIYNNTYDYSFNSYFVSVFVWMGAAFLAVSLINVVHQKLGVQLVANYLIGVCVLQCILSQCMEYIPDLKVFVDGMMAEDGEAFMGNAGNRIHGLGCALDVAGGRFAAVLLMVTFFLTHSKKKMEVYFYIVSFFIIAVCGNMIGRTTTIGVILSLLYIIYDVLKGDVKNNLYLKNFLGISIIIIMTTIVLYNTNNVFQENIRFGFEGFFSLAEKGRWETTSTNILQSSMVVFPDNLKTWMIGDGYGANPSYDPYYTGKIYKGFYMATDIGYLRFLFFFGILGLLSMIALFLNFWNICQHRFPMQKDLVTLILLLNLIIWCKVTSDFLPIFAILLCVSKEQNDAYMLQKQ